MNPDWHNKEIIPGPGPSVEKPQILVRYHLVGEISMVYCDYFGERIEYNPDWTQFIETTITEWLTLKI